MKDHVREILQLILGLIFALLGSEALKVEADAFCWLAWFGLLLGMGMVIIAVDSLATPTDSWRRW